MNSDEKTLITLQNVFKVFTTDEVETHALAGIELNIRKGEYLSISGPSGCGKSTLLAILGLLDTPSDGTYTLNGNRVDHMKLSERARVRRTLKRSQRLVQTVSLPIGLRLSPIVRVSGEAKDYFVTTDVLRSLVSITAARSGCANQRQTNRLVIQLV